MSDREQLAAQIRRLAGKHNHPEMAVSSVILGMVERIAELERLLKAAMFFMDADADVISCQRFVIDECGFHSCTAREVDDALAQQGKGGVE